MVRLTKRQKWTAALFFGLLFGFLVFRACHVSLLPDEAFTYFLYVEPVTFFAPEAQLDANNHVLNSILSFLSTEAFGHSAFALRIPNLFFALVYFYSVYRLAINHSSSISFWTVIIALSGIYPVLEFFSLSRGYGMSFALLILGASLLFDFQRNKSVKTLWFLLLVAFFGLLAQLSLLFAFSGILILSAIILLRTPHIVIVHKLVFSIFSLFLLLSFAWHIHELSSLGLFYFGTIEGFPFSSVFSLVELLYGIKSHLLTYIFTLLFVFVLVYLFWRLFKNFPEFHEDSGIIFPFILFTSLGGTLISVIFLNAQGPLSRTALYFFILLIASLVFIKNSGFISNIAKTNALILSLMSLSLINLNQVNYWSFHAVKPAVYQAIIADTNRYKSMGGARFLDRVFSAEHNIFSNGFSSNYNIFNGDIMETDYLLLTPSETKQYAQALRAYKPIVLDTIGVSLYKNRKASKSIKGESTSFRYAEGSLEYIGVGTYFADSTLHKNLKGFEVSMSSIFPKPNADLSWVISFFDEENKHLETRDFRLNHFSRNWKNGIPFNFYLSVPKIPQQTYEMRMYLYNPRLQPFEKIDVKYKTILCEE